MVSTARLEDIPGEEGWPVIGRSFEIMKDPAADARRMYDTYGPVFRSRGFGVRTVMLADPDGAELLLLDRDRNFSSAGGWNPFLEKLFPEGLMLKDFDEHRVHRRLLSGAFKPQAMKSYVTRLNAGIRERITDWIAADEQFLFYPAIKALTLDLALEVFFGLPKGHPLAGKINQSLADMVAAALALNRTGLPGTLFWRGLKGRAFMVGWLKGEIANRRAGDGDDMFTHLCKTTGDDGNYFDDEAIANHMNFLVMAAHDTITSSLSTMVYELGRNPAWQEKLAEEYDSLGRNDDALDYDDLPKCELFEMAFKEALRINAPVPSIPRKSVREVSFGGYTIPAGTIVSTSPAFLHRRADLWPQPDKFDPERFTLEAEKTRHKYAFVPFGGGAHMCLGLHFAYMQAKIFGFHLLKRARITLDEGYECRFQTMPICKPADGLPIRLTPLA